MAEFLLSGGQSQTWLVGNKLISITTSGSGTKSANSAVCEKCQAAYQPVETKDHRSSVRKRHRSAVIFSQNSTRLIDAVKPSSQDDLSLDLDMRGQDVGVQTGSSLSDASGMMENEPLESLILSRCTC